LKLSAWDGSWGVSAKAASIAVREMRKNSYFAEQTPTLGGLIALRAKSGGWTFLSF